MLRRRVPGAILAPTKILRRTHVRKSRVKRTKRTDADPTASASSSLGAGYTLCLQTCTQIASFGLFCGKELVGEVSFRSFRRLQQRLVPGCQRLFELEGIKAGALDRVAVAVGPGSYTGIRQGVAFAQALARAAQAELRGVGTLDAMAAAAIGLEGAFAPMLDALRDHVYLAVYRGSYSGRWRVKRLLAPRRVDVGSLDRLLPPGAYAYGEGAVRYLSRIRRRCPKVRLLPLEAPSARDLFFSVFSAGFGSASGSLTPCYLQSFP